MSRVPPFDCPNTTCPVDRLASTTTAFTWAVTFAVTRARYAALASSIAAMIVSVPSGAFDLVLTPVERRAYFGSNLNATPFMQ